MQLQVPVALPVAQRRWLPAALAGLLAVVVLVELTPRLYAVPGVHSPAWLGIRVAQRPPAHDATLTVVLYAAAGALLLCWLVLWRRADELGPRRLAAIGAGWSVPLIVGPPLRSLDVYSYAAIGQMARHGLDPYLAGPDALLTGPFLEAVDPIWRHTPTPYGPVLVLLLRCAAFLGGGSVVATVLVLRLLAVAATAGAVLAVVRLVPPERRARALVLTAVNPLVLLDLVSGAHLDALVGLAAVGVVVLAVRSRPHLAMALGVVAGMGKATAFLLTVFVVLRVARQAPPVRRVTAVLGVTGTGVATLAACWLALPDPFGWLGALTVPGTVRGWQAPSEWMGWAVRELSAAVGDPLRVAPAVAAGRALVLVAGLVVVLLVLVRGVTRPDLPSGLRTVGWALVVAALTGPVLYGWYLAWGLLPLAAAALSYRGRRALGVLSAVLVVIGF